MFQVYNKSNNIEYRSADKPLSLNDINSNATSLFLVKNTLKCAKSVYYNDARVLEFTTSTSDPYILFEQDYNGSNICTMQVVIYHTVTPGNKTIENTFNLYIDDKLFESVTLLPNTSNTSVYIFNRRFEIYKPCNKVKLTLNTNQEYNLKLHHIQTHAYVIL